jgi:ankyrin repeat protein
MGKSHSKTHDELAQSLLLSDLTQFASLLPSLSDVNSFLYLSRSVCLCLHIPEDWNPPLLHLICRLSKIPFLKFLLQHYSSIKLNLQDAFGFTALMNSARFGQEEVCSLLLGQGANTNIKNQYDSGDTALHYACEEGDLRIAMLIIAHSSVIDAKNNEEMTPLMYAVQKRHVKLAEILVNRGADPFVCDRNGKSAAEWGGGVLDAALKETGGVEQSRRGRKIESVAESMITYTEHSFNKEVETNEYKPGVITKALWRIFDFAVTDQVSWVRS